MPSHALLSSQSKPILRGHGKAGYVPLHASIPPEQKDALIDLAVSKGTFYVDEVREAISKHLEAEA